MKMFKLTTLAVSLSCLLLFSCKKEYADPAVSQTEEDAKEMFLSQTRFRPLPEEEAKKIDKEKKVLNFNSYKEALTYLKQRGARKDTLTVNNSKNAMAISKVNGGAGGNSSRILSDGTESISFGGMVNLSCGVSGALSSVTIYTNFMHTTYGAVGYTLEPPMNEKLYTSYHLDDSYIDGLTYYATGITGSLSGIRDQVFNSTFSGSNLKYYIDEDLVILGIHYRDVIEVSITNFLTVNGVPGYTPGGSLSSYCNCRYLP